MIEDYLSEKHKKRKKKRGYLYLFAGLFIAYFIFLGIFWIVARSPLFRVGEVIVKGNQGVAADDVKTLLDAQALRGSGFIKAILGFRNMLAWPAALTHDDLRFFPQLADVSIAKDYLAHTITATVALRTPFAIWCIMPKTGPGGNPANDERCYWFDKNGIVFGRTFDTQGSLMVAVHDYSQDTLGLNQKILPDEFTPNLISIVNVVRESGVDVKEIALKDLDLQEIDISTYDGPSLYFSLRFPADNDGPVLASLIGKPNFGKLQYVDFRVENRAYYK